MRTEEVIVLSYQESWKDDFEKIPGSPIAYWASDKMVEAFSQGALIGDLAEPRQGMATSDNERFVRFWYETNYKDINFNSANRDEALLTKCKWFPYAKGGESRKWFGNNCLIVNWQNDGQELLAFAKDYYKICDKNCGLSISQYKLSQKSKKYIKDF